MKTLAGISALLAALAVTAPAGAGSSAQHITLNVGDSFVVAGTNLACNTQVGKNVIPGEKLVTCFKVANGKLPVGSYVVALGEKGRVVVAPVKKGGAIGAPVFNRQPAAVGSAKKNYVVKAGDALRLSGTDIVCAVNSDASGIYPTCFRLTKNGGRPGSLGFAQTTKFVAVVKFDRTGRKSTLVFKRLHAG